MNTCHRIRRQRWRLNASNRAAAFELRGVLRQELDTLNQVFERGLDAACPGENVIHIPRLELTLRIADSHELVEQLSLALAEQLGNLQRPSTPSASARNLLPAQQRRHNLLHFLRHGRLEWQDLAIDATTSSRMLAEDLIVWLDEGAAAWQALRVAAPDSLESAIVFFLRLLNLISAQQGRALIQTAAHEATIVAQHGSPDRAALLQAIERVGTEISASYVRRYLEAVRLAVLAARHAFAVEAVFAQIEAVLDRSSAIKLRRMLGPIEPMASSIPDTAESSAATLPETRADSPPIQRMTTDEPGASVRTSPASYAAANTPVAMPGIFASVHSIDAAEAPGLRVHAAGLVLLHPYLPRFFDACGIERDEAHRIQPRSLPRAAALLHRLATGREAIHEFELDLIKLLLGLPIDTPLPVAAGLLDAADADECEALIGAVISHWSALGSTSVDGLRISFLQRHGLLHDSGARWQLHIESEAFDVLLARLPWSISLIKMPWMTKPIFTDWPTR